MVRIGARAWCLLVHRGEVCLACAGIVHSDATDYVLFPHTPPPPYFFVFILFFCLEIVRPRNGFGVAVKCVGVLSLLGK